MKSPLRILYLEDDLNDIELVRSMLEAEGISCKMMPVETRTDFIAAVEKSGVDIILADNLLPSFDGMSALTIAKEKCPDIPFIFVTGTLGEETAIKRLKDGAMDYVFKQNITRLAPSVRRAMKEVAERKERLVAEKALLESEERYRRIADAIADYIYTVRVEAGRPVETKHSESCFAVTGYGIRDFKADPYLWINMVPEEDRDIVRKQTVQLLSGHSPQPVEHRIMRKDGVVRWVESTVVPNHDMNGDLISYDGIVRDITGRKHAEAEVVRKNRVLDAVNRIFRDALMCETEEELGKTFLSVAEELTGSKFSFFGELNKDGLFDTLAISNLGWDVNRMAELHAGKSVKNMPALGVDRATMRDGKSRIVNGEDTFAKHPDHVPVPAGYPRLNAYLEVPFKHEGKTIGMIGLGNKEGGYTPEDQENIEVVSVAMLEALKSKRAEKLLKDSEERFRLLVDGVRDYAIFMLDPKGHVVSWNEGGKRVYGYNENEIIGRHFSCFFPGDDMKDGKPDKELGIAAAEDRFEDESWRVRKDGSKFFANVVITALWDEAGVRGFVEIVCDITKRRNLEELERFSRLAMGREIQMIRLKQEVNEYLCELGREKKYRIVE